MWGGFCFDNVLANNWEEMVWSLFRNFPTLLPQQSRQIFIDAMLNAFLNSNEQPGYEQSFLPNPSH
jgi:hypothetical protein